MRTIGIYLQLDDQLWIYPFAYTHSQILLLLVGKWHIHGCSSLPRKEMLIDDPIDFEDLGSHGDDYHL